ncbi:histidine kinase [Luteococcus sp. H138]|uniref:sensor histidine kinase n=1 Tax=unclassified Luteococcus TaxID=2639923 RepID=UPI00313D0B30
MRTIVTIPSATLGPGGTLLAAASVLFVLLCALDSAAGNQVEVPVGWLLGDAVLGMCAFWQARRGREVAGLVMSAVATSACGAALVHVTGTASRRGWWRGQVAGATYLVLALVRWRLPWTPEGAYQDSWWGLAVVALGVECLVAWGSFLGANQALVRSLRAQNAALAREQQSAVTAAHASERLAIAREMHDVLAHRLSLISMHSAALEHRSVMSDEERTRAGALIRANARASLGELRGILSDLREEQPGVPQPDLVDLPRLAVEASTPSNPVQVEMDLDCADLAPGIGRRLFRMAQEAVTNAHKHGSAGPIQVTVRQESDHCLLVVTNPVGAPGTTPAGYGLRGITERVQLCGGSLSHAILGGTHVLEVTVPLQEKP